MTVMPRRKKITNLIMTICIVVLILISEKGKCDTNNHKITVSTGEIINQNAKNEISLIKTLDYMIESKNTDQDSYYEILNKFSLLMLKANALEYADMPREIGLQFEFFNKSSELFCGQQQLQNGKNANMLIGINKILSDYVNKLRIPNFVRPDVTMNVPPPPGVSGSAGGDPAYVTNPVQRSSWEAAIKLNNIKNAQIIIQNTIQAELPEVLENMKEVENIVIKNNLIK